MKTTASMLVAAALALSSAPAGATVLDLSTMVGDFQQSIYRDPADLAHYRELHAASQSSCHRAPYHSGTPKEQRKAPGRGLGSSDQVASGPQRVPPRWGRFFGGRTSGEQVRVSPLHSHESPGLAVLEPSLADRVL